MSGNEFFDDMIQALHEVEEHMNGNLKLKSTVVTVPGDEIEFYSAYEKLSVINKDKAMNYVNELLRVSNE